ncbi:hypothetical protein K435DRAFT_778034 [Dendrothele bispora CBS 962.96]|uniref:Uncharacterized protein n=1 Tax=Dendrothele bispora (strain CBS 962.96) TaxID=1314807 RepID=A0A4S8M6N9_DENBC|nr:hypothetical protein K435DRAFT_778034 [Dendrothele bispora CBS 962.96]
MHVLPVLTSNRTPLIVTAVRTVPPTIARVMTKTFCELWKKDVMTIIDVALNGYGIVYTRPHQKHVGQTVNKSGTLSWNRTTSGQIGKMVTISIYQ